MRSCVKFIITIIMWFGIFSLLYEFMNIFPCGILKVIVWLGNYITGYFLVDIVWNIVRILLRSS